MKPQIFLKVKFLNYSLKILEETVLEGDTDCYRITVTEILPKMYPIEELMQQDI